MRLRLLTISAALFCTVMGTARSQDVLIEGPGEVFTLRAGVGVLALEGREYVFYPGTSETMSLLIWQSIAPLLTSSFEVKLPGNWTFGAAADLALAGDSYMEDYDWLVPVDGALDMSNWSHRSRHPETVLEWYFNGSVQVGYDIHAAPDVTINVNTALAYTDVRWSGTGGDFVYSDDGFRDWTGSFGSEPGITYRQQFPALFAGFDTTIRADENWTLEFGAKAGVTFTARATDDHWRKDTRFADSVHAAPVLGVNAGSSYAVTDQLDLFARGRLERVFLGRADSTMIHIPTGTLGPTDHGSSGADLISGTITAGVAGRF